MTTTQTTLTTLARHHLAQRMPNKISAFRSECKTIKEHLKMVDDAMKIHDWASVEELLNEVAAMANQMTELANQNKQAKGW
jgi:hypothetical protein